MKSYALQFSSIEHLRAFIKEHKIAQSRGVIQLFCGTHELDKIQEILDFLSLTCLGFGVIGASSGGEIIEGRCVDNEIIINFLLFKHSKVRTFYSSTTDRDSGVKIAAGQVEATTKVAILLGNSLNEHPENFIEGFNASAPQVTVAGGNAADSQSFQQTFVIRDTDIHHQGIAGVLINSQSLRAETNSIVNWQRIGQPMTVTKASDNVIFSLDNTPIREIFERYLGDDIFADFPTSTQQFPLLIERNGTEIVRSPTGLTNDEQGIVFASTFKTGDQVFFSFADLSSTLKPNKEYIAPLDSASLIYSCANRKALMQENINDEIRTIGKYTRASGFFTYGDYFHKNAKTNVLNVTTTMLTLSESVPDKPRALVKARPAKAAPARKASMLERLTHLTHATGEDLTRSMQFLQQHRAALDSTAIVSITDINGKITHVNSLFEDVSGYKAAELTGSDHSKIRHPDMPDSIFEELWKTITGKKTWQGLIKNRKKNGGFYYAKTTVVPVVNSEGLVLEYFSICTDVTPFVLAQKRIKEHLNDTLSGLGTRAKLSKDIKKNKINAVAVLDVKNFKLLNDYWGVDTGDKLIAEAGRLLRSSVTLHHLRAYRLDGAVFAIMALNEVNEEKFLQSINDIRSALEKNLSNSDSQSISTEIQFSAGIGISESSPLPYAESALIQAKNSNSQQVVLQHENDEAELSFYWINEVRDALNENRVRAFYQEIRGTQKNHKEPRKYEALLRIKLPCGKITSPSAFLSIIKRTPYYKRLTSFIIQDAMTTSRALNCVISVNLSIHDITNKATVDEILNLLQKYGGESLIFEITESEAVTDFFPVNQFIKSVRKYGARVAIDDFGSGYSNFDYLINLKPDFIKIDGSIIKKIASHEQTLLVTQGIIDLAHKMGALVVAEFVADEQTQAKLIESGIDYLQGYFIEKPHPLSQPENVAEES
ncbi:hypothetical protein CWE09_09555 [Aliidiomarina minuta]|uniref:Diguanylate cyclase n=1 Tax=Aliidiomarina minuta TaxID=880057 RepID=A0A432WA56_9GAMM|nr:EAL domain-containing protein [Aliidiomarina minuta]RUO26915.1 hypothetical protein CWE09_09555 [Aliidiomarina minuta]